MSRLPDEAAAKEHQPTRGAVLSTLLETLALSPDESADLALQLLCACRDFELLGDTLASALIKQVPRGHKEAIRAFGAALGANLPPNHTPSAGDTLRRPLRGSEDEVSCSIVVFFGGLGLHQYKNGGIQ